MYVYFYLVYPPPTVRDSAWCACARAGITVICVAIIALCCWRLLLLHRATSGQHGRARHESARAALRWCPPTR